MSSVNVRRLVENMRAQTTAYSPLVEVIANAIQAIDCTGRTDGKVAIDVLRRPQDDMFKAKADVVGFVIGDNGVGFTDENRNSFDTVYSDQKINEGGKGFGRFVCLKYFDQVEYESIYRKDEVLLARTFSMGLGTEIIVNEEHPDPLRRATGTTVRLGSPKKENTYEKGLDTIARNLVERLLPYFIDKNYVCPTVVISDGPDEIVLNDFAVHSDHFDEVPLESGAFTEAGIHSPETFLVRVFRVFSPGNMKSKISLVAHQREVTGSPLHNYVPEFVEDFYTKSDKGPPRNYILKAYVFGEYLNRHVLPERTGFAFQDESDIAWGISRKDIEKPVAEITKNAVLEDVRPRQEKKRKRVQEFADAHPWHKSSAAKVDLADLAYNPSDEQIEAHLHSSKFKQSVAIKRRVSQLLADSKPGVLPEEASKIVEEVSESGKEDLIHYVALRKHILAIFERSLQVDENGGYHSEGLVHDIIFPRKGDTDATPFENHNLWLIDERLNFTSFVSSDRPHKGNQGRRPDLLIYNHSVMFREDNEPSNPVTIVEFKKPFRDNFVDPSKLVEDPVRQVVRYTNAIRNQEYTNPKGRPIRVESNTPFYGYIVCSLTPKVEKWLKEEQEFKPMPDKLGWFQWREGINLYLEVLSWDKVLRDAEMRSRVFFHKLGID